MHSVFVKVTIFHNQQKSVAGLCGEDHADRRDRVDTKQLKPEELCKRNTGAELGLQEDPDSTLCIAVHQQEDSLQFAC